MVVFGSCCPPNACALGHAIEIIQRVKAVALNFDGVVIGQTDARKSKIQARQKVVIQWRIIGTVSYTHLDVYKRQVCTLAMMNGTLLRVWLPVWELLP